MSEQNTNQKDSLKVTAIDLTTFNRLYGDDPTAPMYVLNRSGSTGGPNRPARPRGTILANVTNDDNSQAVIKVPVTFIPIDLTTQAPLHALLRSTTIRQALSVGNLVIADTKSVIKMMSNSKVARDEHMKLFKTEWRSPYGDEGNEEELDVADDARAVQEADTQQGAATTSKFSEVQMVNDIIIASLGGEDSGAIQASILNQLDLLTVEDLNCIAQNVTDSSVKELCLSSLS